MRGRYSAKITEESEENHFLQNRLRVASQQLGYHKKKHCKLADKKYYKRHFEKLRKIRKTTLTKCFLCKHVNLRKTMEKRMGQNKFKLNQQTMEKSH